MGGELSNSKITESSHKQANTSREKRTSELAKVDSKESITSTNQNSEPKSSRGSIDHHKMKRKKEKIAIVAKNKASTNYEKKCLEIIHKGNSKKEDYDLIYNIIDKHLVMQTLTEQARNEIIVTMSLCKVKEGVTLFQEGNIGNYWYIVHEGKLEMYMNGKLKKELERGSSFGEFALINNAPRITTVKAVTECQLWVMKREVFRKIIDFIFQLNYNENKKFLDSINLPLEDSFKAILANNLLQEKYKTGDYICKEGDLGNCMYIIKEGEVNCIKNGKIIRTLKQGDNFGQKAILEETKRSLDVVAKTNCTICSISVDFFKNQLGVNYRDHLYFSFINLAFQNSKFFNKIMTKMLLKVFSYFTFKNFGNSEIMFKKGDKLERKIYIVLEGNIINKKTGYVDAKRYEFLYEEEMYKNESITLTHDLIADPDCILAEIDLNKFQEVLGGNLENIQKKSIEKSNFENIAFFKNLSEDKIELLESKLIEESFDNGRKIISQGEIGDKFYIIKTGRVDFFVNAKYVRSLNDGEEFGAKALIVSEKRSATAIANGRVTVYSLTADVFKSILETNLLNYFQKKIYLEDNTIDLKDLDNVKELGSGNFGFVNLVRSRKNKQLYAIKAQNLYQIKKEKLETCIELEKNVLLKTDHPFIMKMVKYMKNENFIFFLMEYIKGKELWEVIRDIGLLNKEQTQFYSGSMLLAINYLHKKKVIYRDIKPENIMVNDIGYIKIIDFGTVKEIKERTSTIIGTPHYMAPEIVKGGGYTFQVDIWSIAVCMYEFFCGKLPFADDYDDPMMVYKSVMNEELDFPHYIHDDAFKHLLQKMLRKNPTNRLWKFQQIKQDPYFKGFDWNKLISLSLNPPYKIKFKDDKDKIQAIPYLAYLKGKDVKKIKSKGKKTARSIQFEKWFNEF